MLPNLSQVILSAAAARLHPESKARAAGAASRDDGSAAVVDVRAHLRELRRTWQAPLELERGRPRELRLKPAGRALLGFAALLMAGSIAAGVLLYLRASSDHEERRELVESGRNTEGTVVRRWATRGNNRRYWVRFEYTADGRLFAGSVQVGHGAWQRMDAGTGLPVRYLPADPVRHIVPGREPNLMPLWLPYVIGGAMILGGWLATRPLASQRRLLSEGRPAPAIVSRHEKTPHGVVAHFVFAVLSGATVEGRLAPQKKPPEIASVICVLYEPDRVGHNAPYPLSLVRTAQGPPSVAVMRRPASRS